MNQSKLLSLSDRIYQLLLHIYPASFRKEYGRHMAQLFRDDMRNTLQESGTTALIGLWLLTFFDLIKTALAEHTWGVLNLIPLEKMNRWSGPAAAVGGSLNSLGIIWVLGFEHATNGYILLYNFTSLVSAPLLGLGVYGLYKRLSQNSGRQNNLTFAMALTGLIIGQFSTIVFNLIAQGGMCTVCLVAYIIMLFGIAGMGLIAFLTQSLGKWSITPLSVLVFYLLASFVTDSTSMIIVMLLFALSWSLMGVGIMRVENDHTDPAL